MTTSTLTTRDPMITTSVHEGVGVISLARRERLNALARGSIPELREAFDSLGRRGDVRALILRGEGRAFCAGLDLEEGIADPSSADLADAMACSMREGADLVWAMRAIPQPVIAVVDGWAVGAGFAFAAAADVRFIGADAKFSAPFLKLGMSVGDLGLSWFLPRLIGAGRASHLLLDAGVLDAQTAVDYGLAHHVSAGPLAEATTYAQRLAAYPTYGVQASKQLLNASASSSLRDHLDAEARAQTIGGLTTSAKQAMAAVLADTKQKGD